MFRLPNGRPPLAAHPRRRLEHGNRISTLTMGEGPDVLLLHGLGGDEVVVLRHRGRAQPPLPRPRARLPGLRRLEQARAGPLRRAVLRPLGARRDGRAGASSARTWSATRWAAAWRSRSGCASPTGSAASALLCPALAFVRRGYQPLVRLAAPRARPAAALARPRPDRAAVLVDVRRPRPRRPERRRHRRRRVRAHLPLARAPASPSSPARARSTSTRRSAATGCSRAWPRSSRRRCSSGARTTS